MTVLVPFDGSRLSHAALRRAVDLATERDVTAVTILPRNDPTYARERDWLAADEEFEMGTIVERLEDRVASIAPGCDHVVQTVDRFAPPGTIATRIKQLARERDADLVVVGSENAGRVVSTIGSVGDRVAADEYDVYLVRTVRDDDPSPP